MLVQCLTAVSLDHGNLSRSLAAIVSSMALAGHWPAFGFSNKKLTDDEAEKLARLIARCRA
jgi:hypothetical protein